ncbi:GP63-like [Trichomonas vaginalis G3]|uniref:GP63-like n=1 Tax=Trichomonas vaginalis (strain ATCC PRA-98 / G3) TaxID=412133 RepID=A2FGF4_TRIV3|nr:regulation of choline O-acetyltransferase protein [Trichomonas vaginalis G3]EAX96018.1 GP63-like [Trichomonas vaginalis G3]KAI5537103.1 regulation of choline O-acetyltransferase protein [Trichomonas vaginalis G3]|eukprot:XP_001308948.1 GP63-like [Trichomonas vaginalis G3]
MTEAKIKVVEQTVDNVIKFFQNTIKVKSVQNSITVTNIPDLGSFPEMVFDDTDLAIVASSAAYGEGNPIIAAAGPRFVLKPSYRPYIGVMFFNPRFVPEKPSNISDFDNKFFYIIVHELSHALGFLQAMYPYFHPYEDEDNYYSTLTCSLRKFGKKFTFLVTPYSHLYAKKRFGVDKFYGDSGKSCPAGIELEDQGGDGTSMSHLEKRTYFTDLMVGSYSESNTPHIKFSDALMAVLMDTGNYKFNWVNAQPLVFGHQESLNSKPMEEFAMEPPQKVFPQGYFFTENNSVGFDYRSFEVHQIFLKDNENTCKHAGFELYCSDAKYKFYNPNKEPLIGIDYLADFQKIIDPEYYCENKKVILPGYLNDMPKSDYAEGHFENLCGTFKCNGYESFEFNVVDADNKEITQKCTKENINSSFIYPVKFISDKTNRVSKINYCPDPEQFCRTIKLSLMNFNKDPLDEKTKVLEGDPQTPPEWSLNYDDLEKEIKEKKIIGIVVVVSVIVIIALIIALISYCVFCRKLHVKNNQSVTTDNLNNPQAELKQELL